MPQDIWKEILQQLEPSPYELRCYLLVSKDFSRFTLQFVDLSYFRTIHWFKLLRSYKAFGRIDYIKLLVLNDSCNVNSLLELSCHKGYVEITEILLKYTTVNPSNNNHYLLQIACEGGHIDILKLLLQNPKIDPSFGNNKLIKLACNKNNKKILIMLIQNPKIYLNCNDIDLITDVSIINKFTEVIKELIKNTTNINIPNLNKIMLYACSIGNIDIVRNLLENYYDMDPSFNNNEALKLAIDKNYIEIVEELLNNSNSTVFNNKDESTKLFKKIISKKNKIKNCLILYIAQYQNVIIEKNDELIEANKKIKKLKKKLKKNKLKN